MNQRQREDLALELFRPASGFDAVLSRVARHGIAASIVVCALVAAFVWNLGGGVQAAPPVAGTLAIPGLHAPVTVARDARGIPHIAAANEHDLYLAEGYAEGSDRLFQMELTRRFALGRLSEVMGAKALPIDVAQRYYDLRDVVARQWQHLSARDRAALAAFSDGVNAAMRTQALPVEFRLLLYRPEPWEPTDSLAVSLAVSTALGDSWRDVLARDAVWRRGGASEYERYYPLSDPAYDVSASGVFDGHERPLQELRVALRQAQGDSVAGADPKQPRAGSNAWAVGAQRSATGRALLANDPHLDLTIPGLWYLMEVRAPGVHAAGASIPGAPGILLGHNERVAWGATNADAADASAFFVDRPDKRAWVREVFHVRFASDVSRAYYRAPGAFGVPDGEDRDRLVLVRLPAAFGDRGAIATFLQLDRATGVADALRVLSSYRGTPENFVVAGTDGRVAYHMAGGVADDPAWGRYVHAANEATRRFANVPFDKLPSLVPSRDGLVVSANNKMYGAGYPYRLSASFDPPYRAYRIAQLLRERERYDPAYFEAMQMDAVSPIDLEFARSVAAYVRAHPEPGLAALEREFAAWDGDFAAGSHAATLEHAMRTGLENDAPSLYALIAGLRSGDGVRDGSVEADLRGMLYYGSRSQAPWGRAGSVAVDHPLAALRFGFLNGATLPGEGDEYTIHLQEPGFSQSFRAVWDVGNWDAGGIAIPSGESGEIGSGHYTDLSDAWIAGRLDPLPFSPRAVEAATRQRLELTPP